MISRETRLLLLTIALSVAALWILARVRFQDRTAPAAPVPTVLAQLRPSTDYADLALRIAEIRPGVSAATVDVGWGRPALRVRETRAVSLAEQPPDRRLAFDRATGLALVEVPFSRVPGVMPWVPRLLDYPRYFIAVDVADGRALLRPVFVGGLTPAESITWGGEIWMLPAQASIQPGTLVFTTEGAFAGLAVAHADRAAVVPATLLNTFVDRLTQTQPAPGDLGLRVHPLSASIAAASGARAGVVVTFVSPDGPASGEIIATDVIEAIDGREIGTLEHWQATTARLAAGSAVALRVRRQGVVRVIELQAVSLDPVSVPSASAAPSSLGLRLRQSPEGGAEVVAVEPGSASARAGLEVGDRLTVVGGQPMPTTASIFRMYAALSSGQSLLVGLTRGSTHSVTVLAK